MAKQTVNNGDTGLAARTKINENFTELYVPPVTRFNTTETISEPGIYVFYGASDRTWTISNNIQGAVEIRTLSTAVLTLSGSFNPEFGGKIYPGERERKLIWDAPLAMYSL